MKIEDLPFQLLQEITDGFSDELGKGTFGVVYRGVTKNGVDVAVKTLNPYHADLSYKQLQNEFINLTKLKHQNIVKVLGYCHETVKRQHTMPDGRKVFAEETYRALCLEYMHNGSLQKHLSDECSEIKLDWHKRFRIIKGTCEGLKYIHKDLEDPIYHLDLKPDNILLDKDMVPKIADFGLSRIFGEELTRTTNNAYGTPGYQPPEYIDNGIISEKFDIFSLGGIIIRIVSGPNGYSEYPYMSPEDFIHQVHDNWRDRLKATCSSDLLEAYCHQVKTCTLIALKCVHEDSKERPDILEIIEKLNEIEIGIAKLPQKRRLKSVSEMTMHDNNMEMRKKPKDIIGQHQNINMMTSPRCSELEVVDAQETSSFLVEEFIVGRREEKDKIMTSLLEGMLEKIIILPIYGIGGIGKTTFARLIYNDPKFKHYSHVWVHVSQRFDLNKILESINSQLSGKELKKILIVLDDLWEDNQFQLDNLKDIKYQDDGNIVVLVTTRSERIAGRICTNLLQPYNILPLTDDMCWDIIKQRSGFEARQDKGQLMSIGQEIAQKCSGVALAAQSLGFTLRNMKFDQWVKVKENDIWNEHVSKDDLLLPNHALRSLMLSYSYMDPSLKPCFTYCGIFPKGYKIVKNDLIYQWISSGFIEPTKFLSKMQQCEKYITQLLGLSFFQMSAKTFEEYNEQDTSFTMHDLVHDLAISLLGSQILDQSKQGNTKGESCKYALLTDCSKPLESCLSSRGSLIALRFLECGKIRLHGSAFSLASHLCVLDLSECCIQKLPDSIGQLQELRYLNAPGICDQSIPSSIARLSKLKYLNIRGSSKILALPEEIGEMEGLTYIDLSGCMKIQKLPESVGNLKNLEHLDLSNCFQVSGISELLDRLSKLEYLNLAYCENIGKLPRGLGNLTELQYLNISYSSYLEVRQAEVLGSLTKLRYLNVSSSTVTRLPEALGSFTGLKYLNLSGLHCLESLPRSFGNLHSLVHLDLSRCFRVQDAPEALRGLTKLQYLNLICSGVERLGEVIGSLTELRNLNLSHCLENMFGYKQAEEVSRFLGIITTLSNLEHLNLSYSDNIYSIPDTLGELRNLHTLDLSHCENLQRLPASISQIGSLKVINTEGCDELDRSTIPQFNNCPSILFPYFIVHANNGISSSTLTLLEKENPTTLEISRLENVCSVEEAPKIKLRDKKKMKKLTFVWTKDAERFVEDIEVLKELVPPDTLTEWELEGYNSTSFPSWVMRIAAYLPCLVRITLKALAKCQTLPPLGQLPNLESLWIEGMDSIMKIDGGLYGGSPGAFPQLEEFQLVDMKNLEEWDTTNSSVQDGENVDVFGKLSYLSIRNCPKLRMKPYPPRGSYSYYWTIESSDDVISSWEVGGQVDDYKWIRGQVDDHHLPGLRWLSVNKCDDLTCISQDIIGNLCSLGALRVENCESIAALPDWLGELTSLEELVIWNCGSLKALPDSIQQLTNLTSLKISDCPELDQWFVLDRNMEKLRHIENKEVDGCSLFLLESSSDMQLENEAMPSWRHEATTLRLPDLELRLSNQEEEFDLNVDPPLEHARGFDLNLEPEDVALDDVIDLTL